MVKNEISFCDRILLHTPCGVFFSAAPEESCVGEICPEEIVTEPEEDEDSIRVKIADLGNACWIVSIGTTCT